MNEIQVQSPPDGIVFHPFPKRKDFNDITGAKFGIMTILGYAGPVVHAAGGRSKYWWVKCECGNVRKISASSLKYDGQQSCGCQTGAQIAKSNTTHGKTGTLEFAIFYVMRDRCNNPNSVMYKDYGGRGIKVCDRWMEHRAGLSNFLADMGPRPSRLHSLDRIDNNKGYSPENCRWATKKEQARNRSNNVFVEFKGKSQCLSAWAEEYGIHQSTLGSRLGRGWSMDKALSTGIRSRSHATH